MPSVCRTARGCVRLLAGDNRGFSPSAEVPLAAGIRQPPISLYDRFAPDTGRAETPPYYIYNV